jgi:VWFA-related protein
VRTTIRTLLILPFAAILFVVFSTMSAAQQTQPLTEQEHFHIAANEVLLDMVVHDKGNKPLLDLKPADISVTDNGQPVTFTQFRLVNGNQQDGPMVMLLFNRPGFDPKQKSANDTAQQESKRLRDAANRILKLIPESGFQYSVLDVWGRLQLQEVLTTDRNTVQAAIAASIQPGPYGVPTAVNPVEAGLDKEIQTGKDSSGAALNPRAQALAQSLESAIADSIRKVEGHHVPDGLASLQSLVDSLRPVAGRKAIVYFTTTTDLTGDSQSKQGNNSDTTKNTIQTIVGAANRAGVSLYVVRMDDPNAPDETGAILNSYSDTSVGSSNPGPPGTGSGSGSHSGYSQAVSGAMGSASEFRMISAKEGEPAPMPGSLDSLVRGTGGYSFSEEESFPQPVKEMVGDLITYYEATYVPPSANDGKFHSLEVKPQRSGIKVRARSGYQADAPIAATSEPAK